MTLSRIFGIAAFFTLALNSAPAFSDSNETHASDMTRAHIARAMVTTGVVDREPVDQVHSLMNDNSMVFFFTELMGMQGQTVTHRWAFNGQVMGEVPFEVGGPRWRVWSTKNLESIWVGTWTVSVVDENGKVLQTEDFDYANRALPASPAH
ncbi:MAG: DUF2914 domain-containing protein [Deltaproteobacteria bacterium]|nr:DUF2914 domain-containing protein [Deltaproteobacteria bacterium]